MKWLLDAFGDDLNGFRPVFPGSMGEQTAVASANRACRGDFNEGTFNDVVPSDESLEDVRGRVVTLTFFLSAFSE